MEFNHKRYKEHYRQVLFKEEERKTFFRELSKAVSVGELRKVKLLLELLDEGHMGLLARHRENEGESMLHVATKFNQECEIIKRLIDACPELMKTNRKESDDYFGQTPLHIAVAKGNKEAVEMMLSKMIDLSQTAMADLLHRMASGSKFANTVMMGELPLSVAALTFNHEMIDTLLKNKAEIERKNTKGDTVLHSLIRFAAIYPDTLEKVLDTLKRLQMNIETRMASEAEWNMMSMECDHSDPSYIWFVPNSHGLNPLQLAASLSQPAIFQFILNLPKVYCFYLNHDGLFDKKLYDITEIDTVSTEKWMEYQRQRKKRMSRHITPMKNIDGVAKHKFNNQESSLSVLKKLQREKTKSILEMMFDIRGQYAYEFIQQPVVRHIIKTKWLYYRVFYYIWMVLHLLFMISLTVFAVINADHLTSKSDTPNEKNRERFLNVFSYFYLVVGALYLFQEVVHLFFRIKTFSILQILNVLHNGSYRLVLVLFSVTLIVDFTIAKSMEDYEHLTLIIALVSGWWFMVFFLRAHQKFSFFTVMIQKVLFGDMLRFGIIIALFLIAFTAGMYMAFQGSKAGEEQFETYGETMLLLFKLMLGLGDIDALYDARRPWLAVTLFVMLVLLTYVLMFNALIAMMSQTCMLISENRLVQWRVQQLSVIIFFESILPQPLAKLVGTEKSVNRFDLDIKQVIEEKRFYLDMSSIHTEYANAEDIHSMNVIKKKLQTIPFDGQHTFVPRFTIRQSGFVTSPRVDDVYNNSQFNYPLYGGYVHRDNDNDRSQRSPGAPVDPPQESASSPMVVKRKSTRRDRSPKTNTDARTDFVDYPKPKPGKRKAKKKRIEPEGDINESYEDQTPGRTPNFHLNQTHLAVPGLDGRVGIPERRRYLSENAALQDTHIGGPAPVPARSPVPALQLPMQIPVQPAHIPVEQISRMAAHPQPAALDIGIINDSYM